MQSRTSEELETRWLAYLWRYASSGDKEQDRKVANEALCMLLVALGHSRIVKAWEKVHDRV